MLLNYDAGEDGQEYKKRINNSVVDESTNKETKAYILGEIRVFGNDYGAWKIKDSWRRNQQN